MKVRNYTIQIKTKGFCDIHDLTPEAVRCVGDSGIQQGIATFFVVGSTAGITTVEHEPGLVLDLQELFERLAPQGKEYHHEKTWHDGNGFSHVRASLLKPSLTVPLVDGQLVLGTWQQIILMDFDNRSRSRKVVLQMMGE